MGAPDDKDRGVIRQHRLVRMHGLSPTAEATRLVKNPCEAALVSCSKLPLYDRQRVLALIRSRRSDEAFVSASNMMLALRAAPGNATKEQKAKALKAIYDNASKMTKTIYDDAGKMTRARLFDRDSKTGHYHRHYLPDEADQGEKTQLLYFHRLTLALGIETALRLKIIRMISNGKGVAVHGVADFADDLRAKNRGHVARLLKQIVAEGWVSRFGGNGRGQPMYWCQTSDERLCEKLAATYGDHDEDNVRQSTRRRSRKVGDKTTRRTAEEEEQIKVDLGLYGSGPVSDRVDQIKVDLGLYGPVKAVPLPTQKRLPKTTPGGAKR